MTPRPPEDLADLPYADLLRPHQGGLDAEVRYDTVHFDHATFDDEEAHSAQFLECAVTDSAFTGGSLRGARFNEVWLHGTRFVGTGLARTNWLDCTADSCAMAGTEAFGAVLRRVAFRRCKFDSVNLRSAQLDEVVFEDCVLRDVDLGGAKLNEVSFPGSSIERLRLGQAVLKATDLRGVAPLDLADGYDALRGAIIDPAQLLDLAPALAHTLGITVS